MLRTNITPTNTKENPSNKDICNAFGCSNKATEKIYVDAGTFGTISLNLCSSCIKKFQTSKENNQIKGNSSTKTSSIHINRHCNNSITFSKNKQYSSQENDNNKK
jgi:hypothetical protein